MLSGLGSGLEGTGSVTGLRPIVPIELHNIAIVLLKLMFPIIPELCSIQDI